MLIADHRLQLPDVLHLVIAQPLPLGFPTLDADEFGHLNDLVLPATVPATKFNLQPGITHPGHAHQLVLPVLTNEAHRLVHHLLDFETLHIVKLLLGIVIHHRKDLPRIELLDGQDVVLEMNAEIVVVENILPILVNHQDLVVAREFPEVLAPFVGIEAEHIRVKPHLKTSQGGNAPLQQGNLVYFILGQDVPHRLAPLDGQFAHVLLEDQLLDACLGLEKHLQHLGFPIGIR